MEHRDLNHVTTEWIDSQDQRFTPIRWDCSFNRRHVGQELKYRRVLYVSALYFMLSY